MGSNERLQSRRYKVELKITEITRTEVIDSYSKQPSGVVTSGEAEIELLASEGKDLPTVLERLKKNIDLIIEDVD